MASCPSKGLRGLKSDHGKAAQAKANADYAKSDHGKAAQAKAYADYAKSDHGKAAQAKAYAAKSDWQSC